MAVLEYGGQHARDGDFGEGERELSHKSGEAGRRAGCSDFRQLGRVTRRFTSRKIPPLDYVEFVMPSLKLMLESFKANCPDTPVIMFAKDQNTKAVVTEFLKL